MIIDFHTHCFPEKVVNKAISTLIQTTGMTAYLDGTLDSLEKSMNDAGIDAGVLLPIATRPEQTVSINRWIGDIKSSKIIPFGTIHPDYGNWRREIKWLADAKIRGVKFHSDYQGFIVDEKKLFPIYEALLEEGLIILFHAGVDFGFKDNSSCTPKRLRRILDVLRGGKIIAAHMGGLLFWDEVKKYLVGQDIIFDTSHCFEILGPQGIKSIIYEHGVDKIVFATDSPWKNQKTEVERIKSLEIGDGDLEKIFYKNAKKLLEY